jgi:hypothetical protein
MGNFGGTVFTEHVHFKHAIGVRAPSLFPPYPRVIHHDTIINGIGVAYPLAFGHFLHEALPRVITMARLYPHAPILLAINDNIREVLSLLPWIDPARIIEWWAGKWIRGAAGIARSLDNLSSVAQEQQRLGELASRARSCSLCGRAIPPQPIPQPHGRVHFFSRRGHDSSAS